MPFTAAVLGVREDLLLGPTVKTLLLRLGMVLEAWGRGRRLKAAFLRNRGMERKPVVALNIG